MNDRSVVLDHEHFSGDTLLSVIRSAESVLYLFGAGMSVDSGIPDYLGSGGWYRKDGPFAKIGKTAFAMFARSELEADWKRAWGIWGYQHAVMSRAKPHAGYMLLAEDAVKNPSRVFVLTSNADELALRAGFPAERVHQVHGSMFRLQCSGPCCREVWPMPDGPLDLDAYNFLLKSSLPRCPFCGAAARPNGYLFGDSEQSYVWEGSKETGANFASWLENQKDARLLMVEIGCGTGAPGLRRHAEQYLAEYPRSFLIRINDSDATGPRERFMGIQDKALHALCGLDAYPPVVQNRQD